MKALRKWLWKKPKSNGDVYRAKVLEIEDPSQIVSGRPMDRLHGLDAALAEAEGRSMLDVGCHDGTVALAFADAGSPFIDGVDLSPAAVAEARRKFEGRDTDAHFDTGDLSRGLDGLRPKLRRPRYGIVCYLGVHQHLYGQMTVEEIHALERGIMDMAEELFVLRVPMRHMDDLNARLLDAGFAPVTGIAKKKVGPARIYRRVA
ncbi:hypothetical protein roselon_02388 [Roseibacterium elongatum DSM 19469]|uniref:Methyltransferase domain-containing protein n=1 Tax=Roseicyclus elongatus DSM 19469 TaxID=1294273 RepID=W8SQ88_9RHOB|nr:class I SAM-dependent methyltransferase [Roseibacterium elongatum]AHM04715.1 hypothetical protein roselon_02388 [Roseibacterium elongatum DSM 19469]